MRAMDTFVVRLWRPVETGTEVTAAGHTACDPELHGTAQHVASGRAAAFRSGAQLLDVIAELRDAPRGARPEGDAPDQPGATVL